MTGLERYLAVIEGREADYLPRLPILMAFAANYIGSNYGAFASDYRVLVEANLKCSEDFGFDQVSVISDPYRETSGFGGEIEFLPDAVPRCSAPLGKNRDVSNLGIPNPRTSPRMLDRLRAVESLKKCVGGTHSILGWVEGPAAEAADLRGVLNFLYDLVDEPEYARELMELCVDVGLEFAIAQLRAGADTIGIGDAIVSQVSPTTYEELIFPCELRLIRGIQFAGGKVRLHICGDITHLLPQIAQLGADIVDLDWKVNMAEARRVLGRDTVLVGNLNPVAEVQNSNPEAIQRAVREVYKSVGNPYMVGAGCEIPVNTPPENLRALCTPVPYQP